MQSAFVGISLPNDSYSESSCFTCIWQSGIKCGRWIETKTRVDRRGISSRLSTYRRDTKRQRSFLLPRNRDWHFCALPRYFQSWISRTPPPGIPENEFRVAQRRCIDLDDRYSPAARKAARGCMKRGTRERDFNFYLRPIKIVYSSSALVPRENCLPRIIYVSDIQCVPKLLSRAAYRIGVVDELV